MATYSADALLAIYRKHISDAYQNVASYERAIGALNAAARDSRFSKWLGALTDLNGKVTLEASKHVGGYQGLRPDALQREVANTLALPWREIWLIQKAREDKAAAYAGLSDRQRANLAAGRSADDLRPLPSETALADTQAKLAAAQARLRDAEVNNLADRQEAANAVAEAKRLAIEARMSADASAQRQADEGRRLAIEARQSADRARTKSDGDALVAGGTPPAPRRDAASDAASRKGGPGDKSPGMPVWQKVGIAVLAAGGLYLATRKGKGKNYLSALKAPGALV